jgi:hypothetical protein
MKIEIYDHCSLVAYDFWLDEEDDREAIEP